jgi:hypothetical protein
MAEQLQVDPRKVAEVTAIVVQSLEGRRLNLVDVTLALTEVCGRIIAAQDMPPLAMRELATVLAEHLERTIRIGVTAKGSNMGDI